MAEVKDEQQTSNGQPMEAVVNAAKIAAVSAAVGAAAAAAKAFASRHEHHDDEPEEEQPEAEPQDAAVEEPGPEDDDEQPEEEQRDELPREPEPEEEQQAQEEEEDEPVEAASLGDARNAAGKARKQLEELLGKQVESVSSLERTHDGWVAALEVVELSRIPESTDVLASYEVELDEDLDFRRYQQARRYTRSQADSGEQ